MKSLKAFLSKCTVIDNEDNLHGDQADYVVFLQNDQPVHVFDRAGQPHSSLVMPFSDPESLTQKDILAIILVARSSDWIVVTDHTNQIWGIIEPHRFDEIQIAARVTVKQGEFGSTDDSKLDAVKVTVNYYICAINCEIAPFAQHQIGVPIPCCPKCDKPRILQANGTKAGVETGKTSSHTGGFWDILRSFIKS